MTQCVKKPIWLHIQITDMSPPRKRTAAIEIANSSDIRLENNIVHGFDDFTHIQNSDNISAINCEHYPAANSTPPTDDLSQLRQEPPSTTNRSTSSKAFSFPPRRTVAEKPAQTDISRYLPAVCESSLCATLFPSTFRLDTVTNFKVEGQRGGRCPKCGTSGRIISGDYDCEHAELIISSLDRDAISFFERLLIDCQQADNEKERMQIFCSHTEAVKLKSVQEILNIFGNERFTGFWTTLGGICGFISLVINLSKGG